MTSQEVIEKGFGEIAAFDPFRAQMKELELKTNVIIDYETDEGYE